MKVVVFPHELSIGGSQINAIDLAAVVASLGHEVIVYAPQGPLESYVSSKGLRYVPARHFRYRPSVARITQLAGLVRKEKVDLIHAYEWPPCLDAFFGAGLVLGTPIVCTVLGMTVMPAVPRSLPLIMGTEELAESARLTHSGPVVSIEPPIDVENDNPSTDGSGFRAAHGIKNGELLVVTVSRLALDLKLDALVDAIDAIDQLASSWPVRLVIVGDGKAAPQLKARAAGVNSRHGREAITLAGASLDPRSAYAAADVVLGMGSSSMRALAHGKAVIVQGERGFNVPFDEEHAPMFLYKGFYGIGDGTSGGPQLAKYLSELLADSNRRAALGALGRETIVSRFSLRNSGATVLKIYEKAISQRPSRRTLVPEMVRSAWVAAGIEFRNHLPSHKRQLAETERRRLSAAESPLASPTSVNSQPSVECQS